ncbi:hypothetical protein NQ317_017110 [Molorchus minor]|uniref:Uncharacterized protein n=1 Tax=Molorchus minor TaxID=1323400 RepID=A0ABQ9J4W6_9CUCU|nr:hypothetical protein NQ317_017110 [Molorchus minor]
MLYIENFAVYWQLALELKIVRSTERLVYAVRSLQFAHGRVNTWSKIYPKLGTQNFSVSTSTRHQSVCQIVVMKGR